MDDDGWRIWTAQNARTALLLRGFNGGLNESEANTFSRVAQRVAQGKKIRDRNCLGGTPPRAPSVPRPPDCAVRHRRPLELKMGPAQLAREAKLQKRFLLREEIAIDRRMILSCRGLPPAIIPPQYRGQCAAAVPPLGSQWEAWTWPEGEGHFRARPSPNSSHRVDRHLQLQTPSVARQWHQDAAAIIRRKPVASRQGILRLFADVAFRAFAMDSNLRCAMWRRGRCCATRGRDVGQAVSLSPFLRRLRREQTIEETLEIVRELLGQAGGIKECGTGEDGYPGRQQDPATR